MTYTLSQHPDTGQPNIICGTCKKTSYNPGDIENKYCGHCHKFHDRIITLELEFTSPVLIEEMETLALPALHKLYGDSFTFVIKENEGKTLFTIRYHDPMLAFHLGKIMGELSKARHEKKENI